MARSVFGRKNKGFSGFISFILLIVGVFLIVLIFQGIFGKTAKINGYVKTAKKYTLEGNYGGATEQLNKALQLDTTNPLIYDAMGFLNNAKGDTEQAKYFYQTAVEKGFKYNGRFDHKKIGNEYIAKGKYPQALAEFEHYTALKPADKNGLLGLALSLQALERVNESLEAYKKAAAISKSSEIMKYMDIAQKQKDRDSIDLFLDRNGQALLKKSVNKSKLIFAAESFTDKIIGYNNEKIIKLGLLDKMSGYLPGNVITLTLDQRIQKIASGALNTIGAVVVLEPKTGEILAAVSHPKFHPDKLEKEFSKYKYMRNNVFTNRAFESLYEPGSICKIITTAALLESGVSQKDIFPVKCNGSMIIEGKTFYCAQKHGVVKSMEDAIDLSCNIAFQKIGNVLGYDKIYEYATRFGFNTPYEMQLPVALSSIPTECDNKFDLSERATGLGKQFRITPLEAACMAATVANGGSLMKPYMVKEIKNIKGDVIYKEEPVVLKTAIKKETAAQLTLYMIDAVEHGLGKKAKVPGIKVAGKTGTSKTGSKGLDGWFICFAPADNPKIAIAILCDASGKGMDVAAPVARRIIQEALSQ